MLRQRTALFRRPRVGWPVGIEQDRVARRGPGSGCGSRAGRRARWRCSGNEVLQPAAQVLDGVESVHPEEVLLQGADEAFRDAVALGLADEGGRALDAEKADLGLEVARHVVGAVVVTEGETLGRVLLDAVEVAQHALSDRLECL